MDEHIETEIRRTPLYETERELGASFKEYFGWQTADHYTDSSKEHESVRKSVGLLNLSFFGAIKIGGKEGVQFLNGLVTNDVKLLEAGKGMRAGLLTGHGKVKAISRLFGLGEEEFLIINEPQSHQNVFKYIFPFSYAGDFKVEEFSNQCRIISVQGPISLLVMKEICFEPVPALAEHEWIETIIAGRKARVIRASHTGEMGFDILVEESGLKDIWDFVMLKGGFHSIAPVGLRALDVLRIEAGIPLYGIDVDESNMMLETGLADAVSFTKGCYTGQEAVAMATYRGHVSKRLSGLVIDSRIVPSRGDRISKAGKDIGYVTSAVNSPTLNSIIAMGYVKYGFFDAGTDVEIKSEDGTVPAKVVELPFYNNSK